MGQWAADILDFDATALAVFTTDLSHWLSPLLHPSRKHVFAVIPSPSVPGTSTAVNLTMQGVVIAHFDGSPVDLQRHYEDQGLEVERVPYRPEKRQLLPMALNNCVGLTKQVIGIRSWALTPHQLLLDIRRMACSEQSLGYSPAST